MTLFGNSLCACNQLKICLLGHHIRRGDETQVELHSEEKDMCRHRENAMLN